MKNRPLSKKNAILISTLLIALAIPATVIGTQRIQDIRNQAAEEETAIDFTTDFNSLSLTNAYEGIRYSKTIELKGYNAKNSTMYLGCDPNKCGSLCNLELHNPPYGLIVGLDSRTIIWNNPKETNGRSSWDITITAVAPNIENKEIFDCAIQRYTLKLSEKTKNLSPSCSIAPVQYSLSYIPQNFEQSFILDGKDEDGGIASARVELISQDGQKQTKAWQLDNQSSIVINGQSDPALTFDMEDVGLYRIEAYITDSDRVEVECRQDRNIELTIVIPGDNGSPEFETDPYKDATPGTSIDVGETYRYQVEATDPNGDSMDYFVINDTGWVNFTITENKPGYFKALFSGTPIQRGAYTLVLSLNDGFHDHYSTQIWVVDVGNYVDEGEEIPETPDLDQYPQVTNIKPLEKSEITDTYPLISASLKAANGSKIVSGSVTVEMDDTDITENSQIRGEGKETGSITYIPDQPLHKGTHRITVSFDDAKGKTAQKSWTFTIKSEEDQIPVPEEEGIEILGYIISTKMATVLLIGTALVAMAIAIPWVMYSVWQRTQKEEIETKPRGYFTTSTEAKIPPIPPSYISPTDQTIPNEKPEPDYYSGYDAEPKKNPVPEVETDVESPTTETEVQPTTQDPPTPEVPTPTEKTTQPQEMEQSKEVPVREPTEKPK